ncbi:hypothetical protein RB213_000092 [Colletotrichum asianum]
MLPSRTPPRPKLPALFNFRVTEEEVVVLASHRVGRRVFHCRTDLTFNILSAAHASSPF